MIMHRIKKKQVEPEIDLIDKQGHKQKLEVYRQKEETMEPKEEIMHEEIEKKRKTFLIEERQKELDKIEECRLKSIEERKIYAGEEIKQKEFREKIYSDIKPLAPIAVLLVILLISGLLVFKLATVGLAPGLITITESYSYSDNVNLTLSESREYTWAISNYGNLKSVRLDGSITPEGSAKAYLEYDSIRYLIFDSSRLSIEEIEDEPIVIGTQDKARRVLDSIFEFNVVSEFGSNVSYGKLCTMWELNSELVECYGNGECCDFWNMSSSGLWDDSFYLSYGRYDSQLENIIKSQVIYYDVDLEVPYSNIILSDVKEIEAEFYEEVIEFSDVCIETCLLPLFDADSYKLVFEVEDSSLKIDNIRYGIEKEINISRNAPLLVKEIENITIYKNYDIEIDLSEYFSDEDGDVLSYSVYEVENISVVIRDSVITLIPSYNFTGKRFTYFIVSDGYQNITSNVFSVDVVEKPLSPEEVDVTEELIEPRVEINKPVKWVKKVNVSDRVINLDIALHDDALDVVVRDIKNDRTISDNKLKINDKGSIKTISSYRAEKKIEQIDKSIERLENKEASLRGKGFIDTEEIREIETEIREQDNERNRLERDVTAPIEGELSTTTSVIIEDIIEEIEIEYWTEGPISEEEEIANGKRIVVSSDIHYEDILAYTDIAAACSSVKVYRVDNGRQPVSFDCKDGRVEWIIPSLSNATYEVIIEITKAEHLNSSREFVADIYEGVKERDGNWSEIINVNEYVRATFEQNLTNNKDITIYARSAGNGSVEIEVYEKDSENVVAVFENVFEDKKYQIFLNNLTSTSQDVFDLKVLNNPVELDYIVDPTYYYYVDGFDSTYTQWTQTGSSPYLNATGDGNQINVSAKNKNHGDFNFSDLPAEATSINSVNFYIYADCGTEKISVFLLGSGGYVGHDLGQCGSWGWKTFNATEELTTVEEVNNAKFYVRSVNQGKWSGTVSVDAAYLRVDYGETTPPAVIIDYPAEGLVLGSSSINFNLSSNENLSFCKFTLNNWKTNYTMALNSSLTGATKTIPYLDDKNYTAKFWCNDTAGNINNSEEVNFSIDVSVRFTHATDTHVIIGGNPTPSAKDGRTDNCEGSKYLINFPDFYSEYCNTNLYDSDGGSILPTIAWINATTAINNLPEVNFTIITGDVVAEMENTVDKNNSIDKFKQIAETLNSGYKITTAGLHDGILDPGNRAKFILEFGDLDYYFIRENNLFIGLREYGPANYNLTYLDETLETYKNQDMNVFIFGHTLPKYIGTFTTNKIDFINLMKANNDTYKSRIVMAGHVHNNMYQYANYTHWVVTTAIMNYPTEFRIIDIEDDHIHIYMSDIYSSEVNYVSEKMVEAYINWPGGEILIRDDPAGSGKIGLAGEEFEREIWIGTRFIGSCQELNEYGGYYTLNQSITTSDAVCFNVTNDKVTLDLNGYNITGDIAFTDYAVYSSGYSDITVKKGEIYNIKTTAISIESGDNFNIKEISIFDSGRGIFFTNSSYNDLEDITIYNSSYSGPLNGALIFEDSSYNTVENFNITLGEGNLLRFVSNSDGSSSNNNLTNGKISLSAPVSSDIRFQNFGGTDNINNIFLNVTYDTSKISIPAGQLIRKWWYRAFVNSSTERLIEGAYVAAYDYSENLEFNITTDFDGYTERIGITDYVNSNSVKSYYSDYTIYAYKTNYTGDWHYYNATFKENNLEDKFVLINGTDYSVNITINSQFNNNAVINYSDIANINGTCGSEAGICYLYSNISGIMQQLDSDSIAPFFVENKSYLAPGVYLFKVNNTNNATGRSYLLTVIFVAPRIGLDVLWPSDLSETFNATQNEFFNVTVNITCYDNYCGEINATLDPILLNEIMSSNSDSPRIINAEVEPDKVLPGDVMTVRAEAEDSLGIDSVKAEMPHEKGKDVLELELVDGTVYNGLWQNEWLVHDTLEKEYTTTITATNVEGNSASKEVVWWDPVYCEDVHGCEYHSALCCDGLDAWISRIQFNTIDNIDTGGCDDDGYQNFTSISTTVYNGSAHDLTVEVTYEPSSSGEYHATVWIDFNQNGTFDSSEKTEFIAFCSVSCNITESIIIPSDATPGTTRMRIIIEDGFFAPTDSCVHSAAISGEIEDYNITIIEEGANQGNKGIIPVGAGTPFYTNESNPRNITLSEGESKLVTFWVNATGEADSTWEFFVYANLTSDMAISNKTKIWNVIIVVESKEIDYSVNITLNSQFNNNAIINYSDIANINGTCGSGAGTCYLYGNVSGNMEELDFDDSSPFFVENKGYLGPGSYLFKVNNTNNATGRSYFLTVNTVAAVEDSSGNAVNVTIQFLNTSTGEGDYNESGEGHYFNVSDGYYDIKVIPANHTIKEILFYNVSYNASITKIVDIDDPAEKVDDTSFFVVNPLVSFANATITLNASFTSLYKCGLWNWTNQSCYGNWSNIRNLTVGKEYNITLTAGDPGYIELSNAVECYTRGGLSACTVSQINESDNVYPDVADGYLDSFKNRFAQIHSWHNDTDIPDGSTIYNVTVQIEWYVAADKDCGIWIYRNSTDSWHNLSHECKLTTPESLYSYNATPYITKESDAENIQVIINYSSDEQSKNKADRLYVDLISVVVNYTLPTDSCSCPSPGNDWHIINNDQCTWAGECNLGSNKFRVLDGGMSILPGGKIKAGGCYVALDQKLYIDKNGGLYCEQ